MIFFDNASTTKPYPQIARIVEKYNMESFYNPSAVYGTAFSLQNEIKQAKKDILGCLGAKNTDNFIFTSCATESNNMILRAFAKKSGKILVSAGEHACVYNTALDLKNMGFAVEFIKITPDGRVDENDLMTKLTDDVNFVSIIHVNNETGVVNDIKRLAHIVKLKNKRILFHSDGVQAFGKIPVNVSDLGVDFYTISGHKVHAPKGIAGLFIAGDKYVKPLLAGGGQQDGFRSGTENVSGIMAFDFACKEITKNQKANNQLVKTYYDYMVENLDKTLPIKIVGKGEKSPYITMITCDGCRAETLVHMLEDNGILVGNGSACSSKKKDNRNLREMGYSDREIEGAIRISFSEFNTLDEVKTLVEKLNESVKEYLQKVR